ncbi:MAG: OB-fold domain-containing protein [Robiginitomaculum sp.]
MIKFQICQQCQTVHYPERDICPACLSPDMAWQDVSGEGKLVSMTELHISTKTKWLDKLPLALGLVKLKAGPIILAFAEAKLPMGSTVALIHDGDTFKIKSRNAK